ncbi:hypothetical protein [Oscillatoria sp. FACHB-1406]|uniref:hypothetical protein n=1 Tax=Oscillatoria sp. FACHB-1406 TaxID=2692846 RepID=UPI0019C1FE07|nr:hypothetical protein [Oscillatoria sp. FACHB-1406]MBD2580335.1 hypothetical protein [Oscillatoria sp. FACHB-1406]
MKIAVFWRDATVACRFASAPSSGSPSLLTGLTSRHWVGWAAPTSQDFQRLATYIYKQVALYL